ncbi:hypothetical protein [Amycolatopsis rubida]|nr:hypothetical protein [Amycolatopsis rubida]
MALPVLTGNATHDTIVGRIARLRRAVSPLRAPGRSWRSTADTPINPT